MSLFYAHACQGDLSEAGEVLRHQVSPLFVRSYFPCGKFAVVAAAALLAAGVGMVAVKLGRKYR